MLHALFFLREHISYYLNLNSSLYNQATITCFKTNEKDTNMITSFLLVLSCRIRNVGFLYWSLVLVCNFKIKYQILKYCPTSFGYSINRYFLIVSVKYSRVAVLVHPLHRIYSSPTSAEMEWFYWVVFKKVHYIVPEALLGFFIVHIRNINKIRYYNFIWTLSRPTKIRN